MEEIEEIIDSIIECNKKDYSQVINIILSIQTIIKKHASEFSIHQATLNKHATPFLISMLSKAPTDTPDIDEFLHTISSTISSLCGRIASTTNTNKFEFKSGPLSLHESNFSDADLGFQTWDGGIILAEFIDTERIIVKGQNILELGSGTGICGLVCGRMNSKKCIVTDYHPVVLETLRKNINLNSLQNNVTCVKLDWNWCLDDNYIEEDTILKNTEFEMIIAADCIYEMFNAKAVPVVAKHYMSKSESARFHLVVPIRLQMEAEVREFETCMIENGWILCESAEIEKTSLNFRYYCYRLGTTATLLQ